MKSFSLSLLLVQAAHSEARVQGTVVPGRGSRIAVGRICNRGARLHVFYILLGAVWQECEDLMAQGITGSAAGSEAFSGSGRRLGGHSRGAISGAGSLAAAAAERRMRPALPSGPQRLGGDRSLMRLLSPAQAAAMAAERRMKDNVWCGGEWEDAPENTGEENWDTPESRAGGGSEQPLSPGHCQGGIGPHKGTETREGPRFEGAEGPQQGQGPSAWTSTSDAAVSSSVASKRPPHVSRSDPDDAKEGASPKKAKGPGSTGWKAASGGQWSCPACTFLNLVSRATLGYKTFSVA